jgi:hypothetical protein
VKAPPNRQNKTPNALAGPGVLKDQYLGQSQHKLPRYSPANRRTQAASEIWIPLPAVIGSMVARLAVSS